MPRPPSPDPGFGVTIYLRSEHLERMRRYARGTIDSKEDARRVALSMIASYPIPDSIPVQEPASVNPVLCPACEPYGDPRCPACIEAFGG